MSLLSRAEKSIFKKLNSGELVVENAVIIWTNFAGAPTKYDRNGGKRTFNLVLPEYMADELTADGWNVKTREARDEDGDPLYFTEIAINLDARKPPMFTVYTEFAGKKRARPLRGDAVGELDNIDIESVDLVIGVHRYDGEKYTAKGYANVVNVIQAKDEYFGDKYADYYEDEDGYEE